MGFEHYVRSGQKMLRCGYTTGTCAALAAQAAAIRLLSGHWPETVSLITPKGWEVSVTPEACGESENTAFCGIRKDGGDDIDKTSGALIMAEVSLKEKPGVEIDGGIGVGRVTKPGLDQPVGNAAINSTPRRMITEAVEEVARKMDYHGGMVIQISVPEGESIAKKTFNPNMGIVGGISILGTSGIVEPMSTQALIDSICLELRQAKGLGNEEIVLTPGNYGKDFLKDNPIIPAHIPIIQCSNFIGEVLDECCTLGFRTVLLVGHVGKLVKLAGGIMNTHSHWADCRTELFAAHAALCGGDRELIVKLMDCATTDACLEVLEGTEIRDEVLESLLKAIQKHLDRRTMGEFETGAVLFSNVYGELGRTENAKKITDSWKAEH